MIASYNIYTQYYNYWCILISCTRIYRSRFKTEIEERRLGRFRNALHTSSVMTLECGQSCPEQRSSVQDTSSKHDPCATRSPGHLLQEPVARSEDSLANSETADEIELRFVHITQVRENGPDLQNLTLALGGHSRSCSNSGFRGQVST